MTTKENSLDSISTYFHQISSTQADPALLQELKEHHHKLDHQLSLGLAFYVIIDYTDFSYKYVSDSIKPILGYDPQFLLKDGFNSFNKIVFPEDRESMMKGWNVIVQHTKCLPVEVLKQASLMQDFRVRSFNGSHVHILQQTIMLKTDEEGRIIYELMKLTDITHWQKTSPLTCILITSDPDYDMIYIPSDDLKIQGKVFSPAELKVLELMANGEKSKGIAEQLHLSSHTVDTHRRNMLRKTKSNNTQDLIRLAYLSGSL
jgi:DNA-binding CsgD family transcriptional regulator